MTTEPPRITMRVIIDGQLHIQVRYLMYGGGAFWAFAQPEDAALDPLVAKALQLDPSQIEEVQDLPDGQKGYLYRAVFHAHR